MPLQFDSPTGSARKENLSGELMETNVKFQEKRPYTPMSSFKKKGLIIQFGGSRIYESRIFDDL